MYQPLTHLACHPPARHALTNNRQLSHPQESRGHSLPKQYTPKSSWIFHDTSPFWKGSSSGNHETFTQKSITCKLGTVIQLKCSSNYLEKKTWISECQGWIVLKENIYKGLKRKHFCQCLGHTMTDHEKNIFSGTGFESCQHPLGYQVVR